ncbi:MAG: hypothetical protein ACXVHX_35265 [Solirubrobacteraceae bacterium]
MSDISQLVAAIDGRLTELAAEISALESARAALDGGRTVERSPAGDANAVTSRSPARPRRPRRMSSPVPSEPVASGTGTEPVTSVRHDGGAVSRKRSTRKAVAKRTRRPRAGMAVGAETLERVLATTSSGLSANVIAEQAGAGYTAILKLLHELEAAGEVRRSGSRRSTAWRLITDEERIAERAAELERRRSTPTRRRRRASAA